MSERTLLFQREQGRYAFLGSVRAGISSLSYQFRTKIPSYKFVSSRITENILDVISVHDNYLYGKKEGHTQLCTINAVNQLKFKIFIEKSNISNTDFSNTLKDDTRAIKIVWPAQNNASKKHFAGFQCMPENSSLSIVTSLAFKRNAYFLPSKLTVTANVNDTITLNMRANGPAEGLETLWRKNEEECINDTRLYELNQTSITISSADVGHSGIYSLEYKDCKIKKRGYVRLIVRACPEGKYGTSCINKCPQCLNGGICHDITGECICAPGFSGLTCDKACDPGSFGKKCNTKCSSSLIGRETCTGLLFCLPDPYGCSCAAGFTGIFCNETCIPGYYGAGCNQKRFCHCVDEENCNPYSGVCNKGCAEGWLGKHCNEKSVEVSELTYETLSSTTVTIQWNPPHDANVSVLRYNIAVHENWKDHCHDFSGEGEAVRRNTSKTSMILKILHPFASYTVSVSAVVLVDSESDNISRSPTSNVTFETVAAAPSAPLDFHVVKKTSSMVFLTWVQPFPSNGVLDRFIVRYKVIEHDEFSSVSVIPSHKGCADSNKTYCFVMKDLFPDHEYDVQLVAFNENVTEGSQVVSLSVKTAHSAFTEKFTLVTMDQTNSEVTVQISQIDTDFHVNKTVFIVVATVDRKQTQSNILHLLRESNCRRPTNDNAYITGVVHNIPKIGINFTVGNNSCWNGYYNQPLKERTSYKIGLSLYFNYCQEFVYSPILYADKVITLNAQKYSSYNILSPILSALLPLLCIIIILILILIYRNRRGFSASSMKNRFLPNKAIEHEFATCNDALDEMDIIETESICEDWSNSIPNEKLKNYVQETSKNYKLRKEFLSLPKGQLYPSSVAKIPENKFKNRYGNILPYDHSRVFLYNEGISIYIHASYIDGYKKKKQFIATQGPMSSTIVDFWLMIWQEQSTKIVMITNILESGKCKCDKYWPDDVDSYGHLNLALQNTEHYSDFVIRTFKISNGLETREVKQFQYLSWPDHSIPTNSTPFIHFLQKVQVCDSSSSAPIVVHCSAGVGRTGAVILFHISYEMGLSEKEVDVLAQLGAMRKQRMNIVETYDQYFFVHITLIEALCVERTTLSPFTFVKGYDELLNVLDNNSTGIQKQFEVLNSLYFREQQSVVTAAYKTINEAKNRSRNILPSDNARPILRVYSCETDYINAVYIDGYRNKNAFIATQYPLPETIVDFWRMIWDMKCRTIVLLQDLPISDTEPILWPKQGSKELGLFHISSESQYEEDDMIVSNIKLTLWDNKIGETKVVKALCLSSWNASSELPQDLSVILSLLKHLSSKNDFSSPPIVFTCLDGATACGVVCAFFYMIDRFRVDEEIDIFRAVKCTRTNRMQFIKNLDQYRFLYDLAKEYLKNTDIEFTS